MKVLPVEGLENNDYQPCESLCASSGQPCGATRSLRSLRASRLAHRARILGRFAPSHFVLRAQENVQKKKKKKSVSQSTQNGLKRIKMQKKRFNPLTPFVRSAAKRNLTYPCGRFAPSGFALGARYLPHDTPRVPRSVHAKFHDDRIKTMGARGYIHTQIGTQVHRQPVRDRRPFII